MKEVFDDYRCVCKKLLFRGLIIAGGIEIKCRFCKQIQTIGGLGYTTSDENRYLLILDIQGNIIKTDDSATRIVGHTKEELLSMHVQDLIVMLAPTFYLELLQALNHKGHTVILFQSLHRHKDRSLIPIQIEARGLSTSSGQYVIFTVEKKKLTKVPFATGGTLQVT